MYNPIEKTLKKDWSNYSKVITSFCMLKVVLLIKIMGEILFKIKFVIFNNIILKPSKIYIKNNNLIFFPVKYTFENTEK